MAKNYNKNIEKYILKYVNHSRKKAGLNELSPARGLIFLARRHSSKMAKRGKIWHGDNVFVASDYILKRERGSILKQTIIFFLKLLSLLSFPILGMPGYLGISGENVAVMPKGRVKGFHGEISTDKDIAKALHVSWMNSHGHRQLVPILVPPTDTLNIIIISCWSNQPNIRQINWTAVTFPSLYKMIQTNNTKYKFPRFQQQFSFIMFYSCPAALHDSCFFLQVI